MKCENELEQIVDEDGNPEFRQVLHCQKNRGKIVPVFRCKLKGPATEIRWMRCQPQACCDGCEEKKSR